ncbi:hypothetical protein [Helicobacter sp. 23-1045]
MTKFISHDSQNLPKICEILRQDSAKICKIRRICQKFARFCENQTNSAESSIIFKIKSQNLPLKTIFSAIISHFCNSVNERLKILDYTNALMKKSRWRIFWQ